MRRRIIIQFVLFCLVLIIVPRYIKADETNIIKIVIHKRMYYDSKANPEYKKTSGLETEHDNNTFGFNDVEFSIYSLTDYVNNSNETFEKIRNDISNMSIKSAVNFGESKGVLLDKITTQTIDGEIGVAKLNVEQIDSGPINQAFLILETNTPKFKGEYEVTHLATPMLIVLPVENPIQIGEYLSVIHLYPKNFGYTIDELIPSPNDPSLPEELPQTGITNQNHALAYLAVGIGVIILLINKKNNNFQRRKK